MSAPVGGEVLFDAPLEPVKPLAELWREAEPFTDRSPRAGKRLHKPTGLLIRKHLKGDYPTRYSGTSVSLAERLDLVNTHLAKLRELGMHAVSHTTEFVPELSSTNAYAVIGHSASIYVTNGLKLEGPTASRKASRSTVEETAIGPLKAYYEWCRETNVNLMLSDIYDPWAFSWHKPSGLIYLHDIDPRVTNWAPGSSSSHPEPLLEPYEIDEAFANIGR